MKSVQNGDSIIGYLAAITPALLQLIGVVSVGLVGVLKLDEFVMAPDFINMANFLTILISISIISMSSFWDYNRYAINSSKKTNPTERFDLFEDTRSFWKVLKVFCSIAVVGFFIFMYFVLNKSKFVENVEIFAFFQWSAYIVSMSSVSFIIYAFALMKIQQKNNKTLTENYIPRLVDSLRRYGHVENPGVTIDQVDPTHTFAVVRLGSKDRHKVYTDYTGEMTSIERWES